MERIYELAEKRKQRPSGLNTERFNWLLTFIFLDMILLQFSPLSRTVAFSEILILLAAAAFVGWLLARLIMAGRIKGLREDIVHRRFELDECRAIVVEAPALPVVSTPMPVKITTPPAVATFVPDAAIESVADDLKIIEGIGPRIEELLNADGIRTFARLAASNAQHLAEILNAAGARFQIHNPETWPQQAALARDGKWEELTALQERLLSGSNQMMSDE